MAGVIAQAPALGQLHPQEIVHFAMENYSPHVAVSFSGAEDVVLIDMAVKAGKPFRVFSLDTGRLHPETYEFIERVRSHYGIEVEVFLPQQEALEALVRRKGLFSFYREGHTECCNIRKVEPLRRALSSLEAWITGQRRDQSPATRTQVPVVQLDPTFTTERQRLVKFNPLSHWTSREVWTYIRENHIPYNPLHEKGFVSIGCQPCTRPVLPGQHEREGRWWWEDQTKKECGLHGGNVQTHSGDGDLTAEKTGSLAR